MIRSLVEAWQDAYDIEKSVSVDECMIAFKGRVSLRQYMPKKPSKWGLKDWVLAGSDSGYAYNSMLYNGKENVCTKRQSRKSCIANAHRILLLAREEDKDRLWLRISTLPAIRELDFTQWSQVFAYN